MKTKNTTLAFLALALAVTAIVIWNFQESTIQNSTQESENNSPRVEDVHGGQKNRNTDHARASTASDAVESLEMFELVAVPSIRTHNSISQRKRMFTDSDGRIVRLELEGDSAILGIYPSPSSTHYLVCHGTPKSWKVFDQKGLHVQDLPSVSTIAPKMEDIASVRWSWRTDNTLVAVLESYERREPSIPQYPDQDGIPLDVRLYQYDINSKELKLLKLPGSRYSDLARLEGVSVDGVLIVSHVDRNADYWGGRNKKSLHAYDSANGQ